MAEHKLETTPAPMTLEAYKKHLRDHDWYYDFSDDSRTYNKGSVVSERLKAIAREKGDAFKEAYNQEQMRQFRMETVGSFRPYFTLGTDSEF